jgi:hypothetical protein
MKFVWHRGYKIGIHNPGSGWFARVWAPPGGGSTVHTITEYPQDEEATLRAAKDRVDKQ